MGGVARSRFFCGLRKQKTQDIMKSILQNLRSIFHLGGAHSRVVWLQTEFSFSQRRRP